MEHSDESTRTVPIQDVVVVPLKKIVNERGGLMEVQRNDDPHFLRFGQLYVTFTLPGVTKAWYRHHDQIDQIALIAGELLLVLYDPRADSSTGGAVQEVRITGERPLLVQIPIGIWHGFQAVGDRSACLAHVNTVPFKGDYPDEDRLPPDDPGIPYRWPPPAV